MLTLSDALLLSIKFVIFTLLLTSPLILFGIINSNYIRKAEDDFTHGRYVAVVLTNKSWIDKIFINLSGIMFLIMYLKKKDISYKILKKFDDIIFDEFIRDSNCYGLYIIGHGSRHSLKIGDKNQVLEYTQFKGAQKNKNFVVQLHCNNDEGDSLADIITSNNSLSYVSDGYRYPLDNLLYFICLNQQFVKISVSLALVIFELSILCGINKLAHILHLILTPKSAS